MGMNENAARLHPVGAMAYAGLTYEQASKQAGDVVAVAARTGQTILAADHLAVLAGIMRQRMQCRANG